MTANEFADRLREGDSYLLVTHLRPDGDTLCSACALCSALRRVGKRARLYPNPEITESYAELTAPYIGEAAGAGDTVLCVDIASEGLFPKGFGGKAELCIDHHGSNTLYAARTFLRAEKASCGELAFETIEALCGDVTKEEANLLYIAVATDTGCFCYANTRPETLRAAARLIELGADNAGLNKRFFRSFSYSRLALEGMIYSGMRSYRNNAVNIAVITLDMMKKAGATEDDCDDLASLAGKVRGNVVAITVRELEDGRSKVSVRTNELVNANAICAVYGGGGHPMAGGCTLDAPPDEAADMMYRTVCEIWK